MGQLGKGLLGEGLWRPGVNRVQSRGADTNVIQSFYCENRETKRGRERNDLIQK